MADEPAADKQAADATPWTALHDRLHRTLRQRSLLKPGDRLLVAVSGGQDSLCLIRLLLDLQPKWGWAVAIAHCNHRWRPDADANAAHVQQLAQGWGVPFYLATAATPPVSEASARTWRYQALTDMAQTYGYGAIATGHTASDRAETLLYNLIRGSGADGLQALTWQRSLAPGVCLIRPVLDLTRRETADYCQTADLPVWDDSTNHDWRYARNRIRNELLPYLQTHFNPQVEQAIAHTAELLRAEVEYLETQASELYRRATYQYATQCATELADGLPQSTPTVQSTEHPHPGRLNRTVLKAAPLALQRRVIRQFLQDCLAIAPTFEHIEKSVGLISAPNHSQTDPFPGGAIACVEGDWIILRNRN
ncbi:MAG TPA: tRNA lysidine(34) synthetase TilS [Chroococcidiopsis sp.]